jgi:CRP-like cAMP-binding protein
MADGWGSATVFPGVAVTDLVASVDDLRLEEYRPGDVIFAENDEDNRLYVVLEGKAKVGRHSDDGRQCVFVVVGPSEIFGEESALDHGPQTSCAVALTHMRLVSIGRLGLLSFLAKNPEVAEQLLRVLARRIRKGNSSITDTAYADVPARVAGHLLGLAQRFGVQEDGHMRVTTNLTQEQFAQLVGTSRESVNKALCDFVERGWIHTDGSHILIYDSAPLANRMYGVRAPAAQTV